MTEMELRQVSLVLADISGYTNFIRIHKTSLLHAEQIVTDLMEAIIDRVDAPLIVNKLEGDAAFIYAPVAEHDMELGKKIIRQVFTFFDSFKDKQQELITAGKGGCFCEACCNIDQLKLKAFLHCGQVVIKKVRKGEELAGGDVILAHRLLKNRLQVKEYIMMTEDYFRLSGGLSDRTFVPYTDEYEGIGEVKTLVYYPATKPLEVPEVPRMTRVPGFLVEGQRLTLKSLWRRLIKPRLFHNLPY
jgi:hypothetical protein